MALYSLQDPRQINKTLFLQANWHIKVKPICSFFTLRLAKLLSSNRQRDIGYYTAKLVDVWPNGFAQNLTEGILRMRYRDSQEKPEMAKPGAVYHISVDLWATSNVFLAGDKLRLEISSSNFPRFDRNLNTGEEQAHASRMVKATNTVLHDREHPSALILPIVP